MFTVKSKKSKLMNNYQIFNNYGYLIFEVNI